MLLASNSVGAPAESADHHPPPEQYAAWFEFFVPGQRLANFKRSAKTTKLKSNQRGCIIWQNDGFLGKVMPSTILEKDQTQIEQANLETRVQQYGEKIFGLIDQAGSPTLFSKRGFYGTLMEWAMKDEHFKTQLFRFVDVLPTLTSSGETTRHFKAY